MNKIHIFGVYGSGKSTLAERLSLKTGIRKYELDDLKYISKFNVITSEKERIRRLEEICKKDCWITEGTWSNFAEIAFQNSDLMIYTNFSIYIPILRVIKRYLRRKVNGIKYENDSFLDLWFMIEEIKKYYFDKGIVSKYTHNKIAKKNKNKTIIIRNRGQYEQILQTNNLEDLLKFI